MKNEGIGEPYIHEEYEKYEWEPRNIMKTDMQPIRFKKNCGATWESVLGILNKKWDEVAKGSGIELTNNQCIHIPENAKMHMKSEMKKLQKWAEYAALQLTKVQWQGK